MNLGSLDLDLENLVVLGHLVSLDFPEIPGLLENLVGLGRLEILVDRHFLGNLGHLVNLENPGVRLRLGNLGYPGNP